MRKGGLLYRISPYLVIALFLGFWELSSRLELVNPLFIPPFSEVVRTMAGLFRSGDLTEHIRISLQRSLTGLLIASFAGILLGYLLGGWFRRLELVLHPLMQIGSQTNPFILFHVLLLFLGIGETVKVTIIIWTCMWPVLFSTISGVKEIDPDLLKTAGSFGLSRWTLFTKIVVPAAAPSIFTGLRLSAAYSLFMLIAAEMMGSNSGLGWFILNCQEGFQMRKILAAVVVIAIIGLVQDRLIAALQERLFGQGKGGTFYPTHAY